MTLAKVSLKDSSTWYTLLNLIYPIGSLYFSYTSTSPATRFGGSWAAITGRFIYANAGIGTGGANTHTLTTDEMPKHSHSLNIGMINYSVSSSERHTTNWGSKWSGIAWTDPSGGGKSHNNMPAFQTVYCWRRTA